MNVDLTNPIFHDENKAREWLEAARWPNEPNCPHCGSLGVLRLQGKAHRPGLFHCRDCRGQFTVLTGSVMERSHIPLAKWVLAYHLMTASKKGVSAHQLHRTLGIAYNSAWFMCHRIREAMAEPKPVPLGGRRSGPSWKPAREFDMWDSLGFLKNPYDATPLRPIEDDVDLLIGRQDESIKFQTIIESVSNGTVLLSGPPGVGKTSFFNIQQFLMETGKSTFGKKLVSARHLCPIQADDAVHDIALRILHNTCLNVSEYAKTRGLAVPTNTLKAFRWLTGNKGSSFDFSLQIAGFGGGLGKNEELPPPADVSFEALHHILASIADEVTQWYDMAGIFVALDNFENLDEDQIGSVLMAFRDTFFTIPKVWWVVIGQTGLTSLVQVLDPRVAERMSGSVELTPISSDELHQAIDRRVQKFHSHSSGYPSRPPTQADVTDPPPPEVREAHRPKSRTPRTTRKRPKLDDL